VAGVRTVNAVRLGGRRVPRCLDDLVRRRLAVPIFLQHHDELRDLDNDADQTQPDALEREHVPDGRHQRAEDHFHVGQAHVHGIRLVLVTALLGPG